MTPKLLLFFLLALVASSVTQSDDELHIPVENDNQFPPDNHSEVDELPSEGSGAGVIEDPIEITSTAPEQPPILEDVQVPSVLSTVINSESVPTVAEHACPSSCVCNIEGGSDTYAVDCSNSDLTELPQPLDSKTTELNLQNNKLTEIPKEISALKNLKILNVNNNDVMGIVAGSISELPELTVLKLGNNRLIEYPTDLKNSFGLTKLEEIDLGGNDMRTTLKSETFSNFKALRKLTLPAAATGVVEDLCTALKESLQTVCTESCSKKSFDCPDAPQSMDDDLLDFALPGFIAVGTAPEENVDPSVNTVTTVIPEPETKDNVQSPSEPEANPSPASETSSAADEVSLRSAVMNAADEEPISSDTETKLTEAAPTSKVSSKTEEEVVGATTSGTKTGGVDKSVIGFIVAGMVLVVAGITIKKNWSSIRNRFSSSPRNANERTGVNANGTAPEEVPLQEKSPV